MITYKVSYVVAGEKSAGAIQNQDHRPQVGEVVRIGRKKYEVVEVIEITPPREEFQFLHATVKPAGG